jgi:hypothetical protein
MMDNAQEEAWRKKVIGKCYRFEGITRQYGRVDSFRKDDSSPIGTLINIFGKGATEVCEVHINTHVFRDYIEKGKVIPARVFDGHLRSAISKIKFTKTKSKFY